MNSLKLKISASKSLLFILFAAFIAFLGYLIIIWNKGDILAMFAAGFFFLLSAFFVLGTFHININKLGTGELTKEGFYDNGLKTLIAWKDLSLVIIQIGNHKTITFHIDNFEKYSKGANPKVVKRYSQRAETVAGHILLQFFFLSHSLEEVIENIKSLTKESGIEVPILTN